MKKMLGRNIRVICMNRDVQMGSVERKDNMLSLWKNRQNVIIFVNRDTLFIEKISNGSIIVNLYSDKNVIY